MWSYTRQTRAKAASQSSGAAFLMPRETDTPHPKGHVPAVWHLRFLLGYLLITYPQRQNSLPSRKEGSGDSGNIQTQHADLRIMASQCLPALQAPLPAHWSYARLSNLATFPFPMNPRSSQWPHYRNAGQALVILDSPTILLWCQPEPRSCAVGVGAQMGPTALTAGKGTGG